MPLQAIEEHHLAVALAEPRLNTVSDDDLKNMLRYCFALVGIRGHNLPADKEKDFLHQYIRTAYGNHTAAEVRLAFDMAVQGRLGVDPNCFENFSVLYFASIMNAYRRWASEQVRRLDSKTPDKIYTEDQLKKIDEEYLDYKLSTAWRKMMELDKLPTSINTLYQWRKANLRIK